MITAIFDLDGTLADSIADLGNAVNHGLKALGFPLHTEEEYKKFVGNGAMKLCERALPEDSKEYASELHALFREYYKIHLLDNTKVYDGIKETLKTLSNNGVRLAVATNKPEEAAKKIIAKILPDIRFVKILGGVDYRPKKPDAAIIRDILSVLPDNDNTVWMIGDSNVDVQTGKNADVHVIGCLWGFRSREELIAAGADFIAETPEEIADIILNIQF